MVQLARRRTEKAATLDQCSDRVLMDIIVKAAARDDIPAMHDIRRRVRENALSDDSALGHDDYLPYVGDKGETWIAVSDEKIAGFATLDHHHASIWALFVAPEFESRGVGKALLNQLVERARAFGFASVQLTTTPGTRAEKFYCRQGWCPTGSAPNGEVILRLTLDDGGA